MKKIKFFLAAMASVALVGCANEEFVGNSPGTTAEEGTAGEAIAFSSAADKITRATSNTGTAANMLDHQFKVHGLKKATAATTWATVFSDYLVWDSNTKTISNPDGNEGADDATKAINGWEYVGPAGTYSGVAITKNQTTKYWDKNADNYHFVAGSPYANFTFTFDTDSKDIKTASVTGLTGHIKANSTTGGGTAITTNPVYIANPLNVAKSGAGSYPKEIAFNFTRQQSFVRVGVYETNPGYSITDIKFYQYNETTDAWTETTSSNITLASKTAGYFCGTESGKDATATLVYNWAGAPSYTYSYGGTDLKTSKNWYGGELTSGVPATSSAETTIANLYGTDLDMAAATGYFTVMPTQAASAQPILIKCDYTLTAEDEGAETIEVKGATAAIPDAYTFWKPNYSYTYLFKISDKELSPITFDAVVVATTDGMHEGTITTINTPSITTYQSGSVIDKGIKYEKNTAIFFTVADPTDGTLNNLTDGGAAVGAVQVYSLGTTAKTEADMQYTDFSGKDDLFTLGSTAHTVNSVTLPANQHGSFTPTAAGYYAIQYLTTAASGETPAAYTYKVVKVE